MAFPAAQLLDWFDAHQRVLPWRADRDPYRIWVSEVMLQQTQVSTVVPYFERFLRAFPTLAHLAQADEQEVLRQWAGLGYYRRARHLHQAARLLHAAVPGRLPDDPTLWAGLPGVGRYILGAVLSQAFDRRLPILEANTKRLLARYFADDGPLGQPKTDQRLWRQAEAILPARRVGDFNQALMELGALVCTPRQPRCEACPLQGSCAAYQQGLQETLPRPAARPEVTAVRAVTLVVRHGDRYLLGQRPDHGRWSRMWEFPHLESTADETPPQTARRILGERLGLKGRVGRAFLNFTHAITRYRVEMHCLHATTRTPECRGDFYRDFRWVLPAELADYAMSVPQRRVADHLLGG